MHPKLIKRLSVLRHRVLEALGADHYLLKSIELALAANDPVQGRLALDAINGQPEAIWRKLMNGWSRPSWRPEAQDLATYRRATDVELVLDVTARQPDETSSGTELEARTDFRLREDAPPVRIEILEGTGRETALALIRAAVEKLEREWDHLTTQTPDYVEDWEEAQTLIAHYGVLDELRASG